MAGMADPHEALLSFQEALNKRVIKLHKSKLHPELSVFMDQANHSARTTYALVEKGEVKGIAMFLSVESYEGIHCQGLGYAVAKQYRQQGIGADLIKKSIDEFSNGVKPYIDKFYIEVVVSKENIASNKLAAKFISTEPLAINDEASGLPALQYFRLVEFNK